MRLTSRVIALEARRKPKTPSPQAKHDLLTFLETIGDRLKAGDLRDNHSASPAERVAMALERGDAAFASKLLLCAAKRTGAAET